MSVCLVAFGCGLPNPPDIRKQYQENVQVLGGLTAVYPPREMMRIGQLWIGDASTAGQNDRVMARHTVSMLLSDALTKPMEEQRKLRMDEQSRFVKSVANAGGAQPDPPLFTQPTGDSLEMAALPKYTLASVDQLALSGAVPTPMASFLASLGFSQSKYLTVEAMDIEIAELPIDTITDVVQRACADPTSIFGNPAKRDTVQGVGYYSMKAWWEQRKLDAGEKQIAAFDPRIFLLHKMFYMRGIRYIFNDEKAASAVLSAALANQFPTGVTPPTAPVVPLPEPTTSAEPANPPAGTANVELAAQIQRLNAQIEALRTAVSNNGTNTNIAGSYARATAQGVELVEQFERPVAFGYVAFNEYLKPGPKEGQWSGGIEELCKDFGSR